MNCEMTYASAFVFCSLAAMSTEDDDVTDVADDTHVMIRYDSSTVRDASL